MKIVTRYDNSKFPFQKYSALMLSVAPRTDLIGISEILFVENFNHPKSNHDALAHYLEGTNGKNSTIELHIPNIVANQIQDFYFEVYPEIAGLLLSEIFFHEIGHHAHRFKRHAVKKNENEKFANKYAKAGYLNYFKSRHKKILRSYLFASWSFILFNKAERTMFKDGRKDLINWLHENPKGIDFP